MHLDLVDHLRCPEPHDETWLVAATSTVRNRHIVDGLLGCPICRARYPVRDGTVVFGDRSAIRSRAPVDPMRLAALLGLDDGRGVVLLSDAYAAAARPLHELTGVLVIQLDPPGDVRMGDGVSGIAGAARVPLAAHSLRAAAVDSPSLIQSIIPALQARGRLVAPVAVPCATELIELARDEMEWVAETRVPVPVVPLRRG